MGDARGSTETDTLRNGLVVTFRALRADDRDRIVAAFRELDPESIYTRLFSYRRELTEAELDRVMRVDPDRDAMLVVTIGAGVDEKVIAGGRYIGSDASAGARTAEIAFVVEEDYQGLGIAGRLLRRLADIARRRGVAAFEADVLTGNRSMLAVFERSGLPMRLRREGGTVHATLSLAGGSASPETR